MGCPTNFRGKTCDVFKPCFRSKCARYGAECLPNSDYTSFECKCPAGKLNFNKGCKVDNQCLMYNNYCKNEGICTADEVTGEGSCECFGDHYGNRCQFVRTTTQETTTSTEASLILEFTNPDLFEEEMNETPASPLLADDDCETGAPVVAMPTEKTIRLPEKQELDSARLLSKQLKLRVDKAQQGFGLLAKVVDAFLEK